jgi:hypothetical protein
VLHKNPSGIVVLFVLLIFFFVSLLSKEDIGR